VTALQAVGLSLTIPLMMLLVPRFGILGAAASLLISTSVRFAFVMSSFSRFLSLPRPKVLFGRADFRYVRSIAEGRLRLSAKAAEVRI
jgi:O-antigen/teichoic acid export membrane protein